MTEMPPRANPNLVLALGNDILGDDAVGLLAARTIRNACEEHIDVVESGEAGLALIELMEGYQRVLLLDSAITGQHPPGTVMLLDPSEFRKAEAPSPHYAGLPDVLELASRLGIDFPEEIRIVALEVEDPFTIRKDLSPSVREAFPAYVTRAMDVVREWRPHSLP